MKEIKGMLTALVTPFKNGKIDEKAFVDLIEFQIKSGIHGLVPCGSTGEFATLNENELLHLIKLCVDVAAKRVKVVANTGSNNTVQAAETANKAAKLGVDAVMSVVPYYNKPTQNGIFEHFKFIHDSVDLPMILYNVPGRTVADMSSDTVLKLAELPRIIGLKDATSDLERPLKVLKRIKRSDFSQLSGEDYTFLAFNANGGDGCISIASNIVPAQMVEVQNLCNEGRYREALEKHLQLTPFFDCLFVEANPIPIKYAMSLLGICNSETRLPLCELSSENKKKVEFALTSIGLL